jgi:hypothetical protein
MTIDRGGRERTGAPSRSRRIGPPTASEQLETLLGYAWPFPGRPPKHDLSTWTVTDDWPDPVRVTEAEIEVFEQWFGDQFDELFSPEG